MVCLASGRCVIPHLSRGSLIVKPLFLGSNNSLFPAREVAQKCLAIQIWFPSSLPFSRNCVGHSPGNGKKSSIRSPSIYECHPCKARIIGVSRNYTASGTGSVFRTADQSFLGSRSWSGYDNASVDDKLRAESKSMRRCAGVIPHSGLPTRSAATLSETRCSESVTVRPKVI